MIAKEGSLPSAMISANANDAGVPLTNKRKGRRVRASFPWTRNYNFVA
jgi:hypothetical protein